MTLYLGWRSTVVTLAIMGTIVYVLTLFFVPETLNKEKAKKIPFSIISPIKFLFKPRIFLNALTGGLSMGFMFLSSFCFSTFVADRYNLNAFIIGLSIVPPGVASILVGVVGGKVSDILGRNYGRGARLLFSTCTFLLSSIFLIPFAQSFYWNAWSPIIFSTISSGLRGAASSGFSTFCIEEHPRNVSAVLGGLSSGYMIIVCILLIFLKYF